jgi:hypothetical protein
MGVSFIVKTGGGIKKGWDKAKRQLSIDELQFTCPPESIRTVQATPVNSSEIETGQQLAIKEDKGSLLMLSKGNVVGICKTPPPSVLDGLTNLGGYGVGKVDRVKKISGFWDVVIYLKPLVSEAEM